MGKVAAVSSIASFLILVVSYQVASSVIPPQVEHKSRVIDMPPPAGEERKEYDREAFLGKDEAKTFEQLTPEMKKDRLAIIYDKIDKDQNGLVSEEELKDWIQYVQTRYITKNVKSQWTGYKGHENGTLTWETYKDRTYGSLTEEEEMKDEDARDGRGYNYRDMMRRDARRWAKADQDENGVLTLEEFTNFLHPEESKHMKDIIVDETFEDIDKNKDGKISLEEYINDLWSNGVNSQDETEPHWVTSEREQFGAYRDKDKDGFMDRDEVREWILPTDYDPTSAEAKHLMYISDADKDGMLTKDEVLNNEETFFGSQATDFGEALRNHDEF